MLTDTKWVSKIDEKEGGKSGVYWRVTWHDGKWDYCFDDKMRDTLRKALEEELAVQIEKEKNDKGYWNLMNVTLVADKIKPQEPTHETSQEHMAKPEEAPPNPQAVGMITKELGDMIRASKLKEIFGVGATIELVKWYRSQVLGITRIPFDGAKLPDFKTKPE